MTVKIKIAVSSCLLGNAVRYDGLDKRNNRLFAELAGEFELVAVCPEVMAGLGVPRPAVQLIKKGNEIRALGVNDNSLDVSESIINVAQEFVRSSYDICGLILKSRSPSCGVGSTQVFDLQNRFIGYDSGLFARYVSQQKIGFPIVEDEQLGRADEFKEFGLQVRAYANKASLK